MSFLSMETTTTRTSTLSSSSSSLPNPLSGSNYFNLLFLRPFLAVSFVFLFVFLGWVLAWKLVLVHVPLVQEIFGLRKKPIKPKPQNRGRLSKFYNSFDALNSGSKENGPELAGDRPSSNSEALRGESEAKNH